MNRANTLAIVAFSALSFGCPAPEIDEPLADPTPTAAPALEPGIYSLSITEAQWQRDTCGVTTHEVEAVLALERDEETGSLFIDGLASMDFDAQGMWIDDHFDAVEYSETCVVIIATKLAARVTTANAFELLLITNREPSASSTDCAIALEDLEALPCEEIRTLAFEKVG